MSLKRRSIGFGALHHTAAQQSIADPKSVGLDGERRISTPGRRHEAAIRQVKIIEMPGATGLVEDRIALVGSEARSAQNVIGNARQCVLARIDTAETLDWILSFSAVA